MDTTPVWVPQWAMTSQRLRAAEAIIQEQLRLGHIQYSTSPWNSPIFVIKKKSGNWRLLQDLRKVNEKMQIMGPLQCGMPNPNMIPTEFDLRVIDLKDCFFSIPLASEDREKFAFTLPVYNNDRPTPRFEPCVLPQGMANSPSLCQLFVATALEPFRKAFPNILVYHYMDDILISAKEITSQHMEFLTATLTSFGLCIAPDKVQTVPPFLYLGHKLSETASIPALPQLKIPSSFTLMELQSLLGHINWARPFLALSTNDLSPLFAALAGHTSPADVIPVTASMKAALQLISQRFRLQAVDRLPTKDTLLSCAILATPLLPTAVLYAPDKKDRIAIIEWLHLPHTPSRNL